MNKKILLALVMVVVLLLICNSGIGKLMVRAADYVYDDLAGTSAHLLTYEKIYGVVGRIYRLNVFDNGKYQVTSIGDASDKATLLRSGMLTCTQMAAVHRLLKRKITPCPLTPTG